MAKWVLLLYFIHIVIAAADAQSTVKADPFPCMKDAHAREFDFWIGEWDVFAMGTTKLVGKSKIESASGGCMILENWTAIGPQLHNGKSMNYVDPVTNKWIQVWVGSSGINTQN